MDEDQPGRIVALIDMDCFYVQVFVRQQPELKGKPVAVLQYNSLADRGSGAIAVSYEARALGVKRGMMRKDIAKISGDIIMVTMPNQRKLKADLSMFRSASSEVMAILAKHATVFERASIDEAYIDITCNVDRMLGLPISRDKLARTYIAGWEGCTGDQIARWADHVSGLDHHSYDYRLTLAGLYVNMIRGEIQEKTGFSCSAGIGANKIVSKLAAGTHKPNAQTILSPDNVTLLYSTIDLTKIRKFGGKFGLQVQRDLGIKFANELQNHSLADLISRYGDKTGAWMYHIARGRDDEPVKDRALVSQTGCAKNFPTGLSLVSEVEKWVSDLSDELEERLAFELTDNRRIATQFNAHLRLAEGGSFSAVMQLAKCDTEHIIASTLKIINKKVAVKEGKFSDVILGMSIGGGKFVPAPAKNNIFTLLKEREGQSKEGTSPRSSEAQLEDGEASEPELVAANENSKKSLSSFFEKLRAETPVPSEEPGPDVEQIISGVSSVDPAHTNSNSWNTLSEDDARIMLQPVKGAKAKCPVCGKSVSEAKLTEHLDFHTALALQREIETELKQQDQGKSPKRKLPHNKRTSSSSKKQKVSDVQSKSITSFFKKA